MLKYAALLVFCLSITSAFSQDYIDEIAKSTCSCAEELPDSLESQEKLTKLGFCMLQAAGPYSKRLKKDHKISGTDPNDAEKLGQIIGMRMAYICPDQILRLTQAVSDMEEEESTTSDDTDRSIQGTVINIDNGYFVTITIKDVSGRVSKFIWTRYIESSIDLVTNYKDLMDKSVTINYSTAEFFDPKIGEYRNFNVIATLEL